MGRGVIAVALLALGVAAAAPAQESELSAARRRLVTAKAQADAAAARAAALDRAAGRERDAAARARREEAAVAAKVETAAADIAATRARVAIVDRLLADQRVRLAEHQQPVASLLAALQSLARRPAIAALAQPGSVDDLVHVRAVLGSALPLVRARTAGIRADLARTRALQADAALAARALRDGRARLVEQRTALAALQLRHSGTATALGRTALAESDRAIALGEDARDLVDRMDLIGTRQATLADLESLPGPPIDPSEAEPGARVYRLPVAGRLVTGLGEVSENGVRTRGLTFAVAPRAQVIAPAAGRIALARHFRGYDTIVIIDHGEGWTSLVTGLGRAAVTPGRHIAAGMVLGEAPDGEAPQITVELRRRGRPVDIPALIG